jgi:hypothetical protein
VDAETVAVMTGRGTALERLVQVQTIPDTILLFPRDWTSR